MLRSVRWLVHMRGTLIRYLAKLNVDNAIDLGAVEQDSAAMLEAGLAPMSPRP